MTAQPVLVSVERVVMGRTRPCPNVDSVLTGAVSDHVPLVGATSAVGWGVLSMLETGRGRRLRASCIGTVAPNPFLVF